MSKTTFICSNCQYEHKKWHGKCKGCGSEGCVEEISINNSLHSHNNTIPLKPSEPLNIDFPDLTNLTPLKRNSIFVIGGEPGIGKSTLVGQICMKLLHEKVLYCTGEESIDSVSERLSRIKNHDNISHIDIYYMIYIDDIIDILQKTKYDLLIIDSMHTLKSRVHTSVLNVCDMLRNIALQHNIAIILTSHITKDGIIAGPKTIEHMVDVVFYIEGDRYGSIRTLRSVKNRFGSTSDYSMFEMTKNGLLSIDSYSKFICKREKLVSGSVLCPVVINGQIIVLEVQALVVKDSLPRVEVCGYNINKVKMLIGVITKWCKVNLQFNTVYINIIGGVKIDDSCIELAICVSILSSFLNISLPQNILFCGEISLTGDIFEYKDIIRKYEHIQNNHEYKLIANSNNKNIILIKHISEISDIIKNFSKI